MAVAAALEPPRYPRDDAEVALRHDDRARGVAADRLRDPAEDELLEQALSGRPDDRQVELLGRGDDGRRHVLALADRRRHGLVVADRGGRRSHPALGVLAVALVGVGRDDVHHVNCGVVGPRDGAAHLRGEFGVRAARGRQENRAHLAVR